MEPNTETYILESKIEILQTENNKLKQEVLNLRKLVNHLVEGGKLPKNVKK